VLLDFRRWQASGVSGHKHYWSGACEQVGSGKTCRHTRSPYVRGHAWQRFPGINQLLQPGHRCLPARRRPPRCRRRRRALLTASSTKAFPDAAIPFCWQPASCRPRSAIPARTSPTATSVRCCATPGAAQSGPREPGRAAGPAGAWPRDRPAAQPAGGSLLGTHQERHPVPGPDGPTKSGIDALPEQLGPRCRAAALGYVQIDPRGAELLFQIITERDEHASIRIGANLPFR
jgi:hypothetical protein